MADADGEDRGSIWGDGIDICGDVLVDCPNPLLLLTAYLLGGRGFFFSRLALLRDITSKSLTVSADGGGTENEDEDSTSCRASDEALRRDDGRNAWTAGLASRQRPETALNGNSRSAMDGE